MVNSHGNVVIPIPGEIMAVDTKRRVVSAEGVYDYNLAKDLETINSEVQSNIQNLQNLIDAAGGGGTTNYSELINKPKINNIELEGNVTLEIPDSYTKTESDAKYLTEHQNIDGKANKTDVYTKEEVDDLISLGGNFNPNLYYTKTDIDEKGYLTLHQNIDGKANIGDSYTKTQSDNKYALKTDLNSKADRSSLENYVLRTELPEGIVVDSFISRTSTNPVLNNTIYSALQNKQDALVSGTNIKALRSNNALDLSLVGNGFINFKTINGNSIFGTDDIKVAAGEGGGENNIIENITVNGDPVPVSETKTAEITISIPTALSELSSDQNHNTVSETLIEGWNNKIGGNELKTINGQSLLINGNDTNLVVNPANDSNLVHKTGNETITGDKIFSGQVSFESGNPVYFEGDNMIRSDVFITNDNNGATNVRITTNNNNDNRVVVKASETGFSWIQASNGTLDLQSVLDSKLTSSDIPDTADELTYISSNTHLPNNTRSGYTLQRVIEDFDRALDERQNTANQVTSISSSNTNTQYPSALAVYNALSTKQNTLVSGENIKTINGTSILGSGNITIQGGSGGSASKLYEYDSTDGITYNGNQVASFDDFLTATIHEDCIRWNGVIYRLKGVSPTGAAILNLASFMFSYFYLNTGLYTILEKLIEIRKDTNSSPNYTVTTNTVEIRLPQMTFDSTNSTLNIAQSDL